MPPDDTLILCYHSISESWPEETAVTPFALESHVANLLARGYRGATFSEALLAPLDARMVAFTFDDAHRSVLELAQPILTAAGWPGTVFVPTDHCTDQRPLDWSGLDRWLHGEWHHELACMSWPELGRLAGEGWEIGSHTCSHPRLSSLSEAEISHELEASRAEVERRLNRPCETLAYPYGDYDQRVVRAVRAAGYRLAATAPTTRPTPLPLLWPRAVISRDDAGWRFRIRTSKTLRHVESVPLAGEAALRLRRYVGRLTRPGRAPGGCG